MIKNIVKKKIVKVDGLKKSLISDNLIVEEPLEIRILNKPIIVIMRTPGDEIALTVGLLYTERVIKSANDIGTISYCHNTQDPNSKNIINVIPTHKVNIKNIKRSFLSATSCGICGKSAIKNIKVNVMPINSDVKVDIKIILSLYEKLEKSQMLFHKTGGPHASAIFDSSGNLLSLKEDIGRHNAVDKIIGEALLKEKLPFDKHILLVSGRVSFEIMQKALVARIPIVCAISAPTSLGVAFAKEFNMTLLGFLRANRVNIYSGKERIKL